MGATYAEVYGFVNAQEQTGEMCCSQDYQKLTVRCFLGILYDNALFFWYNDTNIFDFKLFNLIITQSTTILQNEKFSSKSKKYV